MTRVYVTSLAWTGMGTVLRTRRDGRLVVEADFDGRQRTVDPSRARPLEREPVSPGMAQGQAPVTAELAPVPNDPPVRNPARLRWVRQQPCVRCGAPPPSEPSHHPPEGKGSMGMKTSDLRTIPACRSCHDLFHRRPRKFGSYEWIEDQIAASLVRWVREMGEPSE